MGDPTEPGASSHARSEHERNERIVSTPPRGSPRITRLAGPTYPEATDRTTYVMPLNLRDQQAKCKRLHAQWQPSHEQR
jgi:hypothetical protein